MLCASVPTSVKPACAMAKAALCVRKASPFPLSSSILRQRGAMLSMSAPVTRPWASTTVQGP